MSPVITRLAFLSIPALIWLSGCSSPRPSAAPVSAAQAPIPDAYWEGDGVPGKPRIVLDLSAQRLRYYKGDTLVGMSPISSGTPYHRTPTGSFKVTEKDLHHRSSTYGDYVDASGAVVRAEVDSRKDARPPGSRYLGANMKYFMRFNGAVGMHEGYLPGYPAAHGCVRLPTKMASIFFSVTPHGTPVQVIGNASNAGPQPHVPVGWTSPVVSQPVAAAAPLNPKEERKKARQRLAKAPKPDRRRSPPVTERPPLRLGQTWYLE